MDSAFLHLEEFLLVTLISSENSAIVAYPNGAVDTSEWSKTLTG